MNRGCQSEKKMIILNLKVSEAATFSQKLFGLIFKKLKEDEIFLINNCSAIHTLWMARSIDVLFLNRQDEVVALFKNFRPFRFSPLIRPSVKVVEAVAGFIDKFKVSCGDVLKF